MSHAPFGSGMVFVGGAARSGTTLLQNMLDCHPAIYGGPVFVHVPAIIGLRNELRAAVAAGWIDQFCSFAEVDRQIARLLEQLLRPAMERAGCSIISEKTTANVLVFSDLLEVLAEARCIRMVRDPRAVLASLLQVGRRARRLHRPAPEFTRSLNSAVAHIRERLEAGGAAQVRYPQRVLTVAYERLVRDPQQVTAEICAFLGIGWTAAMLRPSRQTHPAEKVVANSIWYPTRELYCRDPVPTEIDKWRRSLSRFQLGRITAALGDHPAGRELGYELNATPGTRMAGALAGLSDEVVTAARRLKHGSGGWLRQVRGRIGLAARRSRVPVRRTAAMEPASGLARGA